MVDHARKPFALLGKETGVLPIRTPVLQIDFHVRSVPVAAHHDFAPAAAKFVQRIDAAVHETKLGLETFRRTGSGGHIQRHDTEVVELRLDITTFSIDVGDPDARNHAVGLSPAVDTYPAVAGALGAVKIAVKTIGIAYGAAKVLFLGLELLHADNVRALLRQPAKKPFIDCGTYAV